MNAPAAPQQQRQPDDAPRIGGMMPKPDWQEAIQLMKAKNPEVHGKIYLPKAGSEYGGQVMMVTDTHIVQRVSKVSAIAHSFDHLSNGDALAQDVEAGRLKPGMQLNVKYGDARGEGNFFTFNQSRALEMQKDLKEWAEANITSAAARSTFLKHVDTATKELAQGRPQSQRNAPAPTPAPRAPDRSR